MLYCAYDVCRNDCTKLMINHDDDGDGSDVDDKYLPHCIFKLLLKHSQLSNYFLLLFHHCTKVAPLFKFYSFF